MQSLTKSLSARRVLLPVMMALVAVIAACRGDNSAPTGLQAPDQASQAKLVSLTAAQQLALTQGLMWSTPRKTPVSVTKVITKSGGMIELKGTGLSLKIPKGAVTTSVTFKVTALPGSVVAYDFQPHGTVFSVPLTFQQDLQGTNFAGLRLPKDFVPDWAGGYFADSLSIDQTTGIVAVSEIIPAAADWIFTNSGKSGRVSFPIRHFSGYIISVGRRR